MNCTKLNESLFNYTTPILCVGSALTYYYVQPTSLFSGIGSLLAGGLGSYAFKHAANYASIELKKACRIFQKNQFQKNLSATTSDFTRLKINWVGSQGLSKLERQTFHDFMQHLLSCCTSESLESGQMVVEIDCYIDALLKNCKGLCLLITHQFSEHVKEKMAKFSKTMPSSKMLIEDFLAQKKREGAFFVQFLYSLDSRFLAKTIPESCPVLRNMLVHRESLEELEILDTTIDSLKEAYFTQYLPQFKNIHQIDPKENLSFKRLSEVIANSDGTPSTLVIKTPAIAHALYIFPNEKSHHFLFFDSNDLTFTASDSQSFAKIIWNYLNLTYGKDVKFSLLH